MSYVRSSRRSSKRSLSGLGLEMHIAPSYQPGQIMTASQKTVLMADNYPVCVDPTAPVKNGWGWENGKSCKQLDYPFCSSPVDTQGTGWGWECGKSCIVPSKPAKIVVNEAASCGACAGTVAKSIGGGRFECVTKPPSTGQPPPGTSKSSGPSSEPPPSQKTFSITDTFKSKTPTQSGEQQKKAIPGTDEDTDNNYVSDAGAGAGDTYTQAQLSAACTGSLLKGTIGTGGCCKPKDSAAIMLNSSGQIVAAPNCDAGGGLGKSLPLIAGAAIAILVLSKML